MNKDITHLTKSLQQTNGDHIFYYFNNLETYIQHANTYIISGIEQGDHILFIENDRIHLMLQKKLEKLLTKEQLTKVHFINNFDFYCRNGDFYPPTILNYFSQIAEPYFGNNLSIRAWGHIEWGEQREIESSLEEYEKETSKILKELKITTICAYDSNRVPEPLKRKLMTFHDFLMTDDDLIPIMA